MRRFERTPGLAKLLCAAMTAAASLLSAVPAAAQSGTAAPPPLTGLPGYRAVEARHPEADAVVLFDSTVVSLGADGRVSRERHRAVMLFTDSGINRYGDPRILFNAATQDLVDVVARVYMRDGRMVESQKNAINRTTPFALDRTPDYADWQETVVTHVGIEKGCVAELHYAIRDKAPGPWLSGVEVFASEDPEEVRVLEVQTAGASSLKTASLTGAAGPDSPAPGVKTWTARNVPGRTPYDGGAWEGDCYPVAVYGTAADWPSMMSKIAASVSPKPEDGAFFSPIVAEAIKDAVTAEDKALAIHALALDRVTSVRAPFRLLAAAPRDARRIYESGYASPLDRAVLLAAMLRSGGLEGVLVLATPGLAWPDEAPAAEIFTAAFVAVKTEEGELFLDPASPYDHDTSYGLASRTIVRLDGTYPVMHLMARPSKESGSSLTIALRPGPDGTMDGEGTAVLTGLFSPSFAMRGSGSEAADYVKSRVGALLGGAELSSWNPEKLGRDGARLAFRFVVKLPDAAPGERVYLSIPRPFDAKLAGVDRVRPERSSVADPVRIEPSVLALACTIEPPEAWKIVEMPRAADLTTSLGSIHTAVEGPADGPRTLRRTLTLEQGLVLPSEYPRMRALLSAFGEERLVLERR